VCATHARVPWSIQLSHADSLVTTRVLVADATKKDVKILFVASVGFYVYKFRVPIDVTVSRDVSWIKKNKRCILGPT
jgi:hypothetical protein